MKLSAEKAALEVRLEESEKQVSALQTKIQQVEAQLDAAKGQASRDSGKIDPEKIKLGFAKAVSDLGQQIEKSFPDLTVKSVTFQKMKMPTDYPFTSGVMTTLVSKKTGETKVRYWEAQGNTQGEWRFAQKEAPKPTVASNNPTTPPKNPTTTAANPPSTTPTQPTQPTRPVQPTRPKPVSNGKTHVIDWGNLR